MRPVVNRLVRLAVPAAGLVLAGFLWGDAAQPSRALLAQANPIAAENLLPGTSDTVWDISGAGDPTIQGFASDISINTGQTVNFKIQTDSANFKIDIYRLGYYGGAGARNVATLGTFTHPQNQGVACATAPATGLVDCGNWAVSASWTATGAVSGLYLAKLSRFDGTSGGSSHIVFIVRDDARQADVVVQTSDTTWQAYNQYGGGSLYCGGPVSNAGTAYTCATRSTKVSYNRPFDTRGHDPQSFVFNAEYPLVRWLEANGYNLKYWAGVDTDRRGADLIASTLKPKTFISSGHDEYWSGGQRATMEAARAAGVNLAFFSGNEMFWKTRFEPSIDGSNTAYRTLVSYKETLAGAKIDPAVDGSGNPIWTGTWRDNRFSPPADGGRPENGVTGNIWTVNSGTAAITVPAGMASLRFWQNTRVAALTSGVATLSAGTLGYEWDEDLDNGARPAGLVHLSSTTVNGVEKIVDFGATVGESLTATHTLTLYRHSSGALVFGAGTVQWAWGLDGDHDRGASSADQAMQQSTVNLLADMSALPATPQNGADGTPLIVPSRSTDTFAPTSVITSPAAGAPVQSGNPSTISGTAFDNGGGIVAGVEVSVDGGATWHIAQGTANWSFTWTPGALGAATLRSRAIDDSANVETPGPGVIVTVIAGNCPCTTLWKSSVVPTVTSSTDTSAVELGVKFRSDIDGFVTGIRYYKGPANNGTHQGSLWTLGGTRLATAVFTMESTTGWQQVNFATPVPITANTTYVASYHTNVGGYAIDSNYFANGGVDSPPLHAMPSNTSGGNGVFASGASLFPTQTFNNNNYWVDVVFAETITRSSGLTISGVTVKVIDGSTASITWQTSKNATSRIDYSTDPGLPAEPVGLTLAKTDPTFAMQHSMTLTGLTFNATYYFNITAVDNAGEIQVAMAPGFTVPGPTLHDTASVDFLGGTQTGTYVAETGDGEVILAPTSGAEFTGPSMPAGWIEVPFSNQGYSIIDNGVLMVDGARVAFCATDAQGVCLPGETPSSTPVANLFTSPHSLEFSANFSGDEFQHAGLSRTIFSATDPWALFSTAAGGQLYTRTNTGSGSIDTPLGTTLLGSFHHFRIDWKTASVDYYVDGALVDSQPFVGVTGLRPVAASDFDPFGGVVLVDWMRMSPYAASGTFVSRVFDALTPVDWRTLQWAANTPAATGFAISVRTGSTPTPPADGTASGGWTAFVPVAASGPLTLNSQFIQYRAQMTTSDSNQTPELSDIIISTSNAPVATDDSATVTQNTSYTFPASGPGSLTANDNADVLPQLHITAVSQPAHGAVVLHADGSITYAPALNYLGQDSFTYTVSDGLLVAAAPATVHLSVVIVNHAPTFTAGPDQSVLEGSGAQSVPSWATNISAGAAGEASQLLKFIVSSNNNTLFSAQPAVAPDGRLTYTPAPDANGSATVAVQLHDNGGTANGGADTSAPQTFTIAVIPKVTPTITWAVPDDITYGTGLSAAQLNATADVPGTFVYTPALGTVLHAASGQTISVAFTPTDTVHYRPATRAVVINVSKAAATIRVVGGSFTYDATPHAASASATGIDGATISGSFTFTYLPGGPAAPVNAGIYSVLAGFTSSDPNYLNTSSTGTNTIAIGTATPIVTVTGGFTYDGSAHPVTVTAKGVGGAQVVGTSSVTYAPGGSSAPVSAGAYAATATFTSLDPNYGTASGSASISIGKATASVTAGSGTKVYGATEPALGASTQTGFTTADAQSITLTSARTPGETTGSYVTTARASGAALGNYIVTYVPGAFTITKATATVTANNATKTYGDPNPSFSASYAGLVNGDTVAALGGTLTLTTPATAASGAGTYAVTPAGLTSSNYTINFVPGTLTVARATPAITWANPADINVGTALSATQLNATASVGGTFVFTPPSGTFLSAGNNQTLGAAFTPTDTANYNPTSKGVAINVLAPTQAPTTTSAPSSSLNPSTFGQSVTLTATVTSSSGMPGGSVQFFDGAALLGTSTLSSGTASLTTAIPAGTRSITAKYTGNSQFTSSTSSALSQTVNQATGTTAVAVSLFTVQYSDVQTFTATFTPTTPGGPIPRWISFKIGTQDLPGGPVAVKLVGTTYQAVWTGQLLEPVNPAPPTGQLKPGARTAYATPADPNFVATSGSRPFTITKEDARVTNTMPASVTLRPDGTMTLTTLVTELAETPPTPGDIRNATVAFIDRGTGLTIGTVNVAADGTASLVWTPALGGLTSKTFTIGFLVSNYYNRNATADNVTIVVNK